MKNSIKHTNKILSVLFAFLFISLNIQADDISSKEIKVSGIVQDQTGVELPGVSISVKGIDKGTITNASGEFSIMVSPDATLIVSFVGMETKEICLYRFLVGSLELILNYLFVEEVQLRRKVIHL